MDPIRLYESYRKKIVDAKDRFNGLRQLMTRLKRELDQAAVEWESVMGNLPPNTPRPQEPQDIAPKVERVIGQLDSTTAKIENSINTTDETMQRAIRGYAPAGREGNREVDLSEEICILLGVLGRHLP